MNTDDRDSDPPKRVRSYRDLIVWRKAIDLAVESYQIVEGFPIKERFVLKEQIHRAAVSIPSNIAEGQGRFAKGDFIRFLRIARGSLNELETLLEIASRLGYFSAGAQSKALLLADEVGRMLWVLMERFGPKRWK